MAHANYPVRHLMDLAAELMKIAKHQAAEQSQDQLCGTLDFMVISDSPSGWVKKRRKDEYRVYPSSKCELTTRPYTTWQARLMVNLIRDLKNADAPRNKLKKLYAALFQLPPLAASTTACASANASMRLARSAPGSPLAVFFNGLDCFPFRTSAAADHDKWQTPLSEIAEFYDYIQP